MPTSSTVTLRRKPVERAVVVAAAPTVLAASTGPPAGAP